MGFIVPVGCKAKLNDFICFTGVNEAHYKRWAEFGRKCQLTDTRHTSASKETEVSIIVMYFPVTRGSTEHTDVEQNCSLIYYGRTNKEKFDDYRHNFKNK